MKFRISPMSALLTLFMMLVILEPALACHSYYGQAHSQSSSVSRSDSFYGPGVSYGPSAGYGAVPYNQPIAQYASRPRYRQRFNYAPRLNAMPPVTAPNRFSASDYLGDISNEGSAVWLAGRLPIKVYISDGRGVPGFRNNYCDMVMDSLDEWTRVSSGRIRFQLVGNPNVADIHVSWQPQLDVSGNRSELGNTVTVSRRSPFSEVGILERAQVRLLSMFRGRSFTAQQMKMISLHEIGHALGLQGHSPDPHDIMHASTTSLTMQRPILSQRDINTLNRLYRSPIAGLI